MTRISSQSIVNLCHGSKAFFYFILFYYYYYFFFFALNEKRESSVWAHRLHVTWWQWIISCVPQGSCWGYRSNYFSLSAKRELLPPSHTPRVVIYAISCLVMFDQKFLYHVFFFLINFLYHVLLCLCTHFNKILNESLRVNKLFGYIKSK